MTITKSYKGMAMEGLIAAWYAKITLKDLHRHKAMASLLAQNIPTGGKVLEIAPGPGYFCMELAKLGNYQITGLDISKSFVEIASKNAKAAGIRIDFRHGNASDMPFGNERFDFTFCQAAFKNFAHPIQAIAEMHRVLRPNGVAVISDLRSDSTQEEIEMEIDKMGLGRMDKMITKWTFQHVLLRNAYSVTDIESMISQTSFGTGRIDVDGVGFQVWLEKKQYANDNNLPDSGEKG
jgi:ubiquinone/menaquinone biosynthesis C-methylase UbiE